MSRNLTPQSSLENLKREAKRWLKALRENDQDARARFARINPQAPTTPTLRDVQHALAREHGFAGWTELRSEVARRGADALNASNTSRDAAIPALLAAAERGDAALVGELLDAHPDIVNERAVLSGHTGKRTALHFAMNRRSEAVMDILLARGADTEAEDAAGLTPLDRAALGGDGEMAQFLIDHGARIRLPAAVALERHEDMERLLRESPDSLRPGGRWDKLLIRASERGPARVIEALIGAGASVHARDDHRTAVDGTHGYTALHAAAFNGNADAARVLLAHGADPASREDRYWGTPAGWADYAGHHELRDIILEGPIDIFQAIAYDRNDRITGILTRDSPALERRFGEYVNGTKEPRPELDPAWTPIAFAVANGKLEAVRILADRGANLTMRDSAGRTLTEAAAADGREDIAGFLEQRGSVLPPRAEAAESFDERVSGFLRMACLDWRSGGAERAIRMQDAGRLLAHDPDIARASIYAAVVCGELEELRRILDERPGAVSEIGGPRSWPPLLYLCSARLPHTRPGEHAVAIAQLLLDSGADPNAFYLGGNADIHYTALTCILGRGEEQASMHPEAPELTHLLLERGADPHDNQVLYNVFANNTSRHLLGDDIVWLLELMYQHSVRRGHRAEWNDPTWPMFDMRGAPSLGHESRLHHGARFMLDAAVDRDLMGMAEWLLKHGAGPNTPAGKLWKGSTRTLYQEALARGYTEMAELLARYGAVRAPLTLEGYDAFIDACIAMDRKRVRAMIQRHPEYLEDPRAIFELLRWDRVEVVELLLQLGVSPDITDPQNGVSALHTAAGAGAERSATLLIERGANVDARDSTYDSPPLGWAAYFQRPNMVELLGRYSRDVWHLTYTGRVERLREVLREEPALARVVGGHGDTPLMWLPGNADAALTIASLLVEHGADPAARDAQGVTAADIAAKRGLAQVAAMLRSRGG